MAANIETKATPSRYRPRLDTVQHVASELAKCYRQCRNQEISPAEMCRYTYTLQALGRMLEGVIFEKRLTALEESEQTFLPSTTERGIENGYQSNETSEVCAATSPD